MDESDMDESEGKKALARHCCERHTLPNFMLLADSTLDF